MKNVVEFRDLVLDLITPADSLYASISLDASRMAGNPLGGTNVYAAQANGSLYGVYYRRSSSGRVVYHIKQTTTNSFGYSSQFRLDLGAGITSCPFGTSFVYTAADFSELPTLQTEGDVTVECDISPPPSLPSPPFSPPSPLFPPFPQLPPPPSFSSPTPLPVAYYGRIDFATMAGYIGAGTGAGALLAVAARVLYRRANAT